MSFRIQCLTETTTKKVVKNAKKNWKKNFEKKTLKKLFWGVLGHEKTLLDRRITWFYCSKNRVR